MKMSLLGMEDLYLFLTGVPPKKGGVGRKASFALLMHNYGN